jgi:hypothetical protein
MPPWLPIAIGMDLNASGIEEKYKYKGRTQGFIFVKHPPEDHENPPAGGYEQSLSHFTVITLNCPK